MEELEKSPFVVEDFVEKLFWRTNSVNSENFDPQLLSDTFTQTIKDLRILQERQQRKCEKLESALGEEQKIHAKHIDKLLERRKQNGKEKSFYYFNISLSFRLDIGGMFSSVRRED